MVPWKALSSPAIEMYEVWILHIEQTFSYTQTEKELKDTHTHTHTIFSWMINVRRWVKGSDALAIWPSHITTTPCSDCSGCLTLSGAVRCHGEADTLTSTRTENIHSCCKTISDIFWNFWYLGLFRIPAIISLKSKTWEQKNQNPKGFLVVALIFFLNFKSPDCF